MNARASRWLRAIRIGVLVVAATTGAAALAEEQAAPSAEARPDIERLMQLTGAYDTELIEQMSGMIAQQTARTIGGDSPEAIARCIEIGTEIAFEAINEMFSDGDFQGEMNAIYAKYFSVEDIRQMIAFHETDVGKKSVEVMPKLMGESMQVTMQWMAKINPVIKERATKQLREEGLIE